MSAASGFYDVPRARRNPASPIPPLGWKTCPEKPILTLRGRNLHIPGVFPLNPKPQRHPDVSFPQCGPGVTGQHAGGSWVRFESCRGLSKEKFLISKVVTSSTAGSHQPCLPARVRVSAGTSSSLPTRVWALGGTRRGLGALDRAELGSCVHPCRLWLLVFISSAGKAGALAAAWAGLPLWDRACPCQAHSRCSVKEWGPLLRKRWGSFKGASPLILFIH